MKTIFAGLLMLVSTSLLADKPTECNPNANYHACDNFQERNAVAVPEPGTLALIGLGMASLVVARRRKR